MNKKQIKKTLDIVSFIEKTRQKKFLSLLEIKQFVDLISQQKVPDYQISAWLMVVTIKGLNSKAIIGLTNAMLNSGKVYQLPKTKRIIIDKHSTGGVGDKVSLILLPILVACGLSVAKLSGKGLGYTGGTIDKLTALGVETQLSFKSALERLKTDHIFVMQQTSDIAPVDKVFYTLRDVTGTVMSVPLIASSIMSKKMALKTDFLFLDVKYGSGSFCPKIADAKILANTMGAIAKSNKINLFFHLTSMQQPLGCSVGNLIELVETHDFLTNKQVAKDLKTLITAFAVDILLITKTVGSTDQAKKLVSDVIVNQKAFHVMTNWLVNSGANKTEWLSKTFFQPKYEQKIFAPKSGYLIVKSTQEIGKISNRLGAGRMKKNDSIDFQAGLWIHKKLNDFVDHNDLVCTLYSSRPIDNINGEMFWKAIMICDQPIKLEALVLKYEPK